MITKNPDSHCAPSGFEVDQLDVSMLTLAHTQAIIGEIV